MVFFSGTEVAPEQMPGMVLGLQPHPGTEEGWRSPIKASRTAIQSSPSMLAGQNYVLFFSMEQWGLKPMARLFQNIPRELPPPGIAMGCQAKWVPRLL